MPEANKLIPINYLPAPQMRPFFRGFCGLCDLLGWLGIRPFSVDNSGTRRLLDKGTELARKVEGKEWDAQGDEIHQLWEDTLASVEESINERNQTGVARSIISNSIKYYLERRVNIYQYLLDNPSVLEVKVDRPIIIAGFPRTGSTLMHRLLAEDSNSRAYKYWELLTPTPSPRPTKVNEWRVWKLELFFKTLNFIVSGQREAIESFHMATTTTIEEETVLMWSVGLMNPLTLLHSNAALCEKIVSPSGRSGSYRFLRRCIQILNAHYPQDIQLRLKSPFHSLYLEALLEEFPDAGLITIHRQPKDVVESWLSFMARVAVPTFRERSFRMEEFCAPQLRFLENSGEVMADFLGTPKKENPVDHLPLSFKKFVSDPVHTVESIYEFFDLGSLSPSDRENMKALLGKKEAQKTLLPKYQLSELGMTEEDLGERFSNYNRVFGHLY